MTPKSKSRISVPLFVMSVLQPWLAVSFALMVLVPLAVAGPLAGHRFLVTSVRTGDTEVFIADPDTGDLTNVSRSPGSEDRYPCWSPDGKLFSCRIGKEPPICGSSTQTEAVFDDSSAAPMSATCRAGKTLLVGN